MGGNPRIADDLGSIAGRLARIGADAKELKPRLDLRHTAAADDWGDALALLRAALNALRRLEIHAQGGVAAPIATTRGERHG